MADYKEETLVPENYDESHAHIPVSCNFDCGGNCPLIAHIVSGKIVKISNNLLGGSICHDV